MRLTCNLIVTVFFLFFSNLYADHRHWNNPGNMDYYERAPIPEAEYDSRDSRLENNNHSSSDYTHGRVYEDSNPQTFSYYDNQHKLNANPDRRETTDFYYFKQPGQAEHSQSKSFNSPGKTFKKLPLSSLDVEDERNKARKRKFSTAKTQGFKTVIPVISSGSNIQRAKYFLSISKNQCHQKLRQQRIKFRPLSPRWGIKYPIRINAAINGIRFRNTANSSAQAVMDCRFAVALSAWTKILKRYGIYEVSYMRTYTPGATVKGTNKRSGHSWGLAIDVANFKSRQYGELNVKYDWTDQRRISPCIKSLKSSQTLRIMRAIVCKTANKQLFAMILTPHYNKAHHDHLHIELRPSLRRLVLR